ncbi:perforin-1-like isoform 1-T2 [Clarias gariepinus]|uniref:perforin-1-like n=1 Tax=Clarias gariepinus TaxID=13013 RepID=UPI00234E11BC|nr:perforin-1-like [Clarias gariepinus]XP_053370742.1 perforin-1-like [Clarias gariepinus]
MLQTLLICAIFAANLPPPTSQGCFKANESQCDNADFVPGSDLAGEGFDITTMQRKDAFVIDLSAWLQKDKTCTLCKNPYMGGQKQKLPVSVVDWRPSQKCKIKVSSSVYESSESLVSSSTSIIKNDWKVGLDISTKKGKGSLMLAGTNSKLADYSMEKTKKDKFSFTGHTFSCGYYRYRVSSRPILNPEVKNEFSMLPATYDDHTKPLFFKLIDMFGTHYITKVSLGGEVSSVTSIKKCHASLQGLTVDEVKTCLDVEASASVKSVSLRSEYHHCQQAKDKTLNKKSFSSSFSDRETNVIGGHTQNVDLLFSSNTDPKAYKDWVSSLPAHPDVISYSLKPLHELLPANDLKQKNLRNAIKDYILQRGLWKNCTSPCKIGVKTNAKEPCTCSCHNNPGVSLNCCPTQRGFAQITVTAVKATGLWGDYFTQTDGYVKLFRNGKVFLSQTPVIWNKNFPNWNWDFNFNSEDLTQFKSVKLEVWDRDSGWDDDLLGACTVQLKSGVNNNFCTLNHGTLYYKVQVKCIPGLVGPTCLEYKPSPMDAHLEKVYVSRHARLIPKGMLLEMGVLLDERIPRFNQNFIKKAAGFEL